MVPNSETHQPYEDRRHAGAVLAKRLEHFKGRNDIVVLALPRGGVPVAHEVARTLDVPLDVFLVRKLGVPGHRELAMGAIASGGVRVLNGGRRHDVQASREGSSTRSSAKSWPSSSVVSGHIAMGERLSSCVAASSC